LLFSVFIYYVDICFVVASYHGIVLHLLMYNRQHHVQHLSSGGGAEVLQVPSGDGFEAGNSINFLGQSILFHNLLNFTL
jgi:hypothetical protein